MPALFAHSARGSFTCGTGFSRALHYFGLSKWPEYVATGGSDCSFGTEHHSFGSMLPSLCSQRGRSSSDVTGGQVLPDEIPTLIRVRQDVIFFHGILLFSANPDKSRHARALFVCATLTTVAAFGLYFLWSTHSISTWLLAVSGFSLEVVCKVLVSLALYSLFLADAKLSEFWDKLDDYVYRVR